MSFFCLSEHRAVSASTSSSRLLTADGRELKVVLKKHKARQKRKAFLLVAPLLLFVLVGFCLPILDMLRRSTDNRIVEETLPRTILALKGWEAGGEGLPSEQAFAALAQDLVLAQRKRRATQLGQRLNYEFSGLASLFRRSGREMEKIVGRVSSTRGSYKETLIAFDARWGEVDSWRVLKRFSDRMVGDYYLAALDMRRDLQSNEVSLRPTEERIYLRLFGRTVVISLGITLATLLLGFPLALWIAKLPTRQGNILLVMVLLPFWTSLLVRTTSWIVLLQQQGVINDLLVAVGILSEEGRLRMIYNTTGTVVAMTHILLPFMVLPLYSVMKTISPSYMRAAVSLGAHPISAFWKVYFPSTIPGIGAGAIMVFILAIGYYITPELVGGRTGVFISNRIAYHISSSLNWGLAAALGVALLAFIVAIYWLYDKIVGIDNIKLG